MRVLQELVQSTLRICHQSSWPLPKPSTVVRSLSAGPKIRLMSRKWLCIKYDRLLSNYCRPCSLTTDKFLTCDTFTKTRSCEFSYSFERQNYRGSHGSTLLVINCQNLLEQHIVQVSDKHCSRLYVTDSSKTSYEKPLNGSGKLLNSADTAEKTFEPDTKSPDLTNQTGQRHDLILTVPNVLTFFRMLITPVLGYLVLTGSYTTACLVFVVASFTDVLDGFIARHFANQTSALGSFIDPLADKFLVSVLFLSLTAVNLIPVALTALVIVRDICLMSGGFYVRYISLNPRPKSLRQYFDVTNATARLQPTTISKLNTAIQLSLVAFTLASPVFGYVDHPVLQILWYLTAASTVVSGVGYIYAKDTFKILKQTNTHKP